MICSLNKTLRALQENSDVVGVAMTRCSSASQYKGIKRRPSFLGIIPEVIFIDNCEL